jgi:hypothetical protein
MTTAVADAPKPQNLPWSMICDPWLVLCACFIDIYISIYNNLYCVCVREHYNIYITKEKLCYCVGPLLGYVQLRINK